MAWTFYEFGSLSLFSEKHAILVPLCLRGIAMGMLFAPLTTVAIHDVPNRRMAQASGLLNVIRQLGGSFGVAVMGSIMTRRMIYHTALYGEQVDPNSDAFRQTLTRLQGFARQATGGTGAEALAKARAEIGSFVANQAFIRAIDDVFLVAGAVIVVGVIPVMLIKTHKARPDRRAEQGR
jgi:MFS transporter, DHA2 family, multidrug resistance protein